MPEIKFMKYGFPFWVDMMDFWGKSSLNLQTNKCYILQDTVFPLQLDYFSSFYKSA